jgi:uncharacterized MAPEG superfamily protein
LCPKPVGQHGQAADNDDNHQPEDDDARPQRQHQQAQPAQQFTRRPSWLVEAASLTRHTLKVEDPGLPSGRDLHDGKLRKFTGRPGVAHQNAMAQQGGWLPFDRFMALALYQPGLGYYANDRASSARCPSRAAIS